MADESTIPTAFVEDTPTLKVLNDILKRLDGKLPQYVAELFPETPNQYRLNHPIGAFLLSYGSSKFDSTEDVGLVIQPRNLELVFNVVARQLNGRDGAVFMCDQLRAALLGYQPALCSQKISAAHEKFLGVNEGIWMYAVHLTTQMMSIQGIDDDY